MNESQIRCRTCDSQNHTLFLIAKDLNQEKTGERFPYRRCNNCKSIFLQPIPTDLGLYYGKDYSAYSVRNSSKIERNLHRLEQAKLDIVKEHAPPGRLVEVGPATGRFLSIANQAGYQVLGIEQDRGCVEHITSALNLDVKFSDTPSDELSRLDNCDVIVAWHVIEHLQNLRDFVSAAANALSKPRGVVIVSTPNPEAWSFKLFAKYWIHLDAPRHLTLIPLQALDRLMEEHGLKRVASIFDDAVGLQLNRVGWQISMMNLCRITKVRRPLLSGLGRILAFAMQWPDRSKGRGSAYTAIYKIESTPPDKEHPISAK